MCKTKAIQAKNITELSNKLNELENVRATQVFPKDNGDYDCLVYFQDVYDRNSSIQANSEPPKRSINPITDRQRSLLTKAIEQKAWDGKIEDLNKMSKQEAYLKIKELMGR